jgi:hypothetical protein
MIKKHIFSITYLIIYLADAVTAFYGISLCRRVCRSREFQRHRPVREAKHTHVEGEAYPSEIDELEAIGGDPFFLNAHDEDGSADFLSPIDVLETFDKVSKLRNDIPPSGARGIFQELSKGIPSLSVKLPQYTGETNNAEAKSETGARGADTVCNSWADSSRAIGSRPTSGLTISDALRSTQKRSDEDFESDLEEILYFGGDPSFLNADDRVAVHVEKYDDDAYDELLASGGDPFFLDEDDATTSSGMDVNDLVEIEKHDTPSPMEMLSMLGALNFASDSALADDGKTNMETFTSQQSLWDEIEDIGGDPFFLEETKVCGGATSQGDHIISAAAKARASLGFHTGATGNRYGADEQGSSPNIMSLVDDNDNVKEWEWDGIVDEDAHLSLD